MKPMRAREPEGRIHPVAHGPRDAEEAPAPVTSETKADPTVEIEEPAPVSTALYDDVACTD